MKKPEEALKDFSKAISLRPDDPQYHIDRADLYVSLKKERNAIEDYNKAIELDPNDDYLYGYKANGLEELEKYNDSIIEYTKAIEIRNKGLAVKRKRRTIADIKPGEVVRLAGERNWYARRAFLYINKEEYAKGIQDFTSEININKSNAYYCLARAQAYQSTGDYAKSYKDLIQAYDKYTNDKLPEWAFNDYIRVTKRCKVLMELGRYEEILGIVDDFDRNILKEKQVAGVLETRGSALWYLGKYKEAINDLLEANNLDAENDVNNSLGLLYSYLGEYETSLKYYNNALKKEPDSLITKYNIAIVVANWKGVSNAKHEILRSKRQLEKLLGNEKETSRCYYGLGGLLAVQGDFDNSRKYLSQAIQISLDPVDWALHDIAWKKQREEPEFRKIVVSRAEFWKKYAD